MTAVEKLGLALFLFIIAMCGTAVTGWVFNIINVIHHTGETTGLFIAQVAGIFFPPLGSFLGFFY